MELSSQQREEILTEFLLGRRNFEDLRGALAEYVEFGETQHDDFHETSAHFHRQLNAHVILRPETVRPFLQAYLDWKVNEEQLERWATVLQMINAYSNPEGLTDQELDDHMAMLWDLLSDLSINPTGKSMRERVALGLADLAELETWLRSRAV